jgi:hypothetical protein
MLMPLVKLKKKPGLKPGFEVEKYLNDKNKLIF